MRALNSLAAKMSEKWEMLHFPLWEKRQALLDRNKNVIQQPDLEPFLWLFISRRWQTQQRVSSACQYLLTLLWDIRFWLLNLWTPAEHVSSASSAAAEVWETDAAVIRTGIQPVCVPPPPPHPHWCDYPPVRREDWGFDHILIPFPVCSTLVSGFIKITDITGIWSWAASHRNSSTLWKD